MIQKPVRTHRTVAAAGILVLAVLAALCFTEGPVSHARAEAADDPPVFTADIQAGIERHIEEQTRKGKGYFNLEFNDHTLRLKLVKVHTEYLANLGPDSHFACVDLADVSGDVYDVDFFLIGKPGSMRVTETIVHKKNGQPYYAWEQKKDKTWHRIPIERASEGHFGVIRGEDRFEFRYWAEVPELKTGARMWLPLPETGRFQTVEIVSLKVPGKQRIIHDRVYKNRILVLDLEPEDSGEEINILFKVQRDEKSAYTSPKPHKRYLQPNRLGPITKEVQAAAQKAVAGKKGDLVRARALYDHVIDQMRYIKTGKGWGQGNAAYACSVLTGNCTDYHAYFIALAQSVGIPARFTIGAGIPSERDNGGVSGYHCWAEFYADGQWWPVDISEADKYSGLATYYFGHHPANRFAFTRGRDLEVDPLPASGPINFLAYPLLEIDGKPVKAKVVFTFKRTSRH